MPNLNDYLNTISQQSDYIKTLPGQRDQGVTKLKTDLGYDEKMKNLEGINKQVFQTQQMLEDLPKNVQSRVAGRPVSNAQLNGITAAQQAPLTQSLGKITNNYNAQQLGLSNIDKQINDFRSTFDTDASRYLTGLGSTADAQFKKYSADSDVYQKNEERNFQKSLADQQSALQRQLAMLAQPKPAPTPTPTNGGNKVPVGQVDGSGKKIIGYDQKGNPIYEQKQVTAAPNNLLQDAQQIDWNPFSQGNADVVNQYQSYRDKNQGQWYDNINPIKNFSTLANFLGGAR